MKTSTTVINLLQDRIKAAVMNYIFIDHPGRSIFETARLFDKITDPKECAKIDFCERGEDESYVWMLFEEVEDMDISQEKLSNFVNDLSELPKNLLHDLGLDDRIKRLAIEEVYSDHPLYAKSHEDKAYGQWFDGLIDGNNPAFEAQFEQDCLTGSFGLKDAYLDHPVRDSLLRVHGLLMKVFY